MYRRRVPCPREREFDLWTSEVRRVLTPDGVVFVIDHEFDPDDPTEYEAHMKPRDPELFAEAFGRRFIATPPPPDKWAGLFVRGSS